MTKWAHQAALKDHFAHPTITRRDRFKVISTGESARCYQFEPQTLNRLDGIKSRELVRRHPFDDISLAASFR